ncbi:MAG: hypothetical protein Q9168_007774, partial [Polycauliona sp. 1 TL-2023]
MPLSFLSLPAEIRNQIYLEILTSTTSHARSRYVSGHAKIIFPTLPLSLLLTNQQIHTEASTLFQIERYWQSRISYDSAGADFRDPLENLLLPLEAADGLSLVRNLEITVKGPRTSDYSHRDWGSPDNDGGVERQMRLTIKLGKLLAVLVDEIADAGAVAATTTAPTGGSGDQKEFRLRNLIVHLPCLCQHCDWLPVIGEGLMGAGMVDESLVPEDTIHGEHWERPDVQWKTGVTPASLAILLNPLKRLRVSGKIVFEYDDCDSPFPAVLEPVLKNISDVVRSEVPVAKARGEREAFRDVWIEARRKGYVGWDGAPVKGHFGG